LVPGNELWIYSANGYLRSFQGDATAQSTSAFALEAQICYAPCTGQIYLKLENSGSTPGEISVSANVYRTDGPWTLALAAGLTGSLNWNIEPVVTGTTSPSWPAHSSAASPDAWKPATIARATPRWRCLCLPKLQSLFVRVGSLNPTDAIGKSI